MALFITSLVPFSIFVRMFIWYDPGFCIFYGYIGFPIMVALTVNFIGRTVRAKDLTTAGKAVWITALILFFPIAVILPSFAFLRILMIEDDAEMAANNPRLHEWKSK